MGLRDGARGDVPVAPSYWPRRLAGRAAWRSRDADPAGDWPRRLAGRAAWRRHCPSGEGARYPLRQWRRFGNGLTAAFEFHVARALIVTVTCASTRSEHGTPGPRRRQARSPAAAVPNTPGCRPDERLSSRPRGAGWSEAVRGTGVPRAAKGAVDLRTALHFDWPPSPCGAGGMAPPLPLRRGGQAPEAPMASVRQWPHRRAWASCCECAQASFFTASTTLSATQWRWASDISP
jgi:hypothetical protein